MKTKMYKLLLLIMLTGGSNIAFGQFHIGLKENLNINTQSENGELWNNADINHSYTPALILEYDLSSNWAVRSGVSFMEKGLTTDILESGHEYELSKAYDYLGIPLLSKNYISLPVKNARFYMLNGVFVDFLTSAENSIDRNDEITTVDISDDSYQTDWGIRVGGGLDFKISNRGMLFCELGYDLGLGKINKKDEDLRNKTLSLALGLYF